MDNTIKKERNLKAYSIYDNKAAIYLPPFYNTNDQVAIRTFTDILQNPNTPMNRHPEDYSIYHVGYFNEETGSLDGCPKEHFIDATTILNQITN